MVQGRLLRPSDTREVVASSTLNPSEILRYRRRDELESVRYPATHTHKPQEECSQYSRLRSSTLLTTEKPTFLMLEILALKTSGMLPCSLMLPFQP